MHKAFWDILREQINEDPPVYDHALVLLAEIKEVSEAKFQLESIQIRICKQV